MGKLEHSELLRNRDPGHVAQGLEERIDPNVTDAEGNTPLHWAARENSDPTVIEVLLNGGADPMIRNGNGEFPLHRAAKHNDNPAIIHALIDREVPRLFVHLSIQAIPVLLGSGWRQC